MYTPRERELLRRWSRNAFRRAAIMRTRGDWIAAEQAIRTGKRYADLAASC